MAQHDATVDADGVQRLKIIIAGDGACGKTYLLCAYIGKPPGGYTPTVLDTYSTTVPIRDVDYPLEIMDTAGQEDLEKIRSLAYDGTHCVIVCYSVIAQQTINNITNFWDPELKAIIPKVPLVVCGNKLDLKEEKPALYISNEAAEAEVKSIKRVKTTLQCSSLDAINGKNVGLVEAVFNHAIVSALDYRQSQGMAGRCCSLL